MSTQSNERIPEWTLGDRLRKARSLTGLTTRDFAERIGVSHGTVTNAENDARTVRPITIKQWALVAGVPEEWLLRGTSPGTPPPGPGETAPERDRLAELTARKRGRGGVSGTHRYPSAA